VKQFLDRRLPWIISLNCQTARGHVGLGRNSLNLGSLGYHVRDLSATSFVNRIAIAVFSLENRQTVSSSSPASAMRYINRTLSSRRMFNSDEVGGTGEGVFILDSNPLSRSETSMNLLTEIWEAVRAILFPRVTLFRGDEA